MEAAWRRGGRCARLGLMFVLGECKESCGHQESGRKNALGYHGVEPGVVCPAVGTDGWWQNERGDDLVGQIWGGKGMHRLPIESGAPRLSQATSLRGLSVRCALHTGIARRHSANDSVRVVSQNVKVGES